MHTAIAAIPDTACSPIRYPDAVWDAEEQRWTSDAGIAETPFTACTPKPKAKQLTARLLGPVPVPEGQDALFPGYRHHGIVTDSPLPLVDADICPRKHAIIKQVIADLEASALVHLPSGKITANAAWLALAAISSNLARAAGCAAGTGHARATTPTLRRRRLVTIPARMASSARRLILHLPQDWPWRTGWQALFTTACGPPGLA